MVCALRPRHDIHDHGDFAPRLAFAWGLGRGKNPSPKTVLRVGSGLFYDRFASSSVLQAERLNGVTQQQLLVANPDSYPNMPPLSTSSLVSPTIYQISPGAEGAADVAIRGQHRTPIGQAGNCAYHLSEFPAVSTSCFCVILTRRLPGTFDPPNPTSGVRPLGAPENIYQYDSEGIFRQNQLIVNSRISVGTKVSLFGFYSLNYSNSDLGTGGGGNGANFLRTRTILWQITGDRRSMCGTGADRGHFSFPYAIRLSPFMLVTSGSPFDITVGQDLNGDSIFNDRPGIFDATGSTTTRRRRSCARRWVRSTLCRPRAKPSSR